MRHEMSLRPKPFAAIADGSKRYELRLHDEKRRLIVVGDEVLFTCTDGSASVLTRVTGLHPFGSFADLYAALPLTECGYTPENVSGADPRDMEAYYPPQKQAQYGVLAIELERVRLPVGSWQLSLSLRPLTDADLPALLTVAQGNPLYYQHMRVMPAIEGLREAMKSLPPRKTASDKYFLGLFDGARLVGVLDLIRAYPREGMAFIGWFMLDARYQGRSLGRRLIGELLTSLKAQGIGEVRLGRVQGNPQSERFWHACGFSETGDTYDTDGYTVVVMSRKI